MTPRSAGLAGLVVALLAGVWIAYAPARDAPFVFDDVVLQADPALAARSVRDVRDVLTRPGEPRRIGYASFALGSWLGARTPGDHRRANLAIHVVNGLLVFLLGRDLARRVALPSPELAAGLGALLWALHPVQTQAVTYVCQRFASLMTLFYLAALLCFATAARRAGAARAAFLLAGGAAAILALGTKQNAATLPLFALLLHGWPRLPARRWLWLVLGAVLVAGLGWLALGPGWAAVEAGSRLKGFTPLTRVMTEWRVVGHYASLLFWPDPARLHLDYAFPLSHGLLDPPSTLLALLGIGAALAVALAAQRREPLLAIAVLWFLGQLAIESSFLPLDLVYEHRLYLPSVLPALAVASLLLRPGPLLAARGVASVVLALGLASWTRERNSVWRDPITLFEDEARKTPGLARIQANLAKAYLEAGRAEDARRGLEAALALDPGYRGLRVNLAAIELRGGGDLARAQELLEEEVRRHPRYAAALANLGVVHLRRGAWTSARGSLEEALAAQPGDIGILQNLVAALLQLREGEAALTRIREALATLPRNATLLALEGAVQFHQGDRQAARERLREALSVDSAEPTARTYWSRLGPE